MSMFCYQCQEALNGTGCTVAGICGKKPDTSNMLDLLLYNLKGLSILADKLSDSNKRLKYDNAIIFGLFTTVTNVNFDTEAIKVQIKNILAMKTEILASLESYDVEKLKCDAVLWNGSTDEEFNAKAASVGVLAIENEDVRSLKELLIYGVKGLAAYLYHANHLTYEDVEINDFIRKAMIASLDDTLDADALVGLVLEAGKFGVDVMALLDKAHTNTYGDPEITKVNLGVRSNPAILISGHDLKDLEQLLEQTEGTGVDVYTHGEMLPAHYYPKFKKYENFVGNYGDGWWKQTEQFPAFNGPVVMTTNCLVPPHTNYADKLYTTGAVGYPGMKQIEENEDGILDFTAVIEHAKQCKPPVEIESGELVGGFAHKTVIGLADKVIDAVKSGAVKKFVVMAGCDAHTTERSYYTEFAEKLPDDNVILTAGCAKYRYNKLELGDIGGIPRVLDAGQCNDSYSLAVIALKLKEAFGLDDVNELPIVYNIAWYEQKAVIVLLALLHLGVKNIHLGPTLPAFLSPNVVNVLVENFGIGGISNVDEDIENMILK